MHLRIRRAFHRGFSAALAVLFIGTGAAHGAGVLACVHHQGDQHDTGASHGAHASATPADGHQPAPTYAPAAEWDGQSLHDSRDRTGAGEGAGVNEATGASEGTGADTGHASETGSESVALDAPPADHGSHGCDCGFHCAGAVTPEGIRTDLGGMLTAPVPTPVGVTPLPESALPPPTVLLPHALPWPLAPPA